MSYRYKKKLMVENKYRISRFIGESNIWRVEYLANRSVIVVGVTLIWRKAVAAIHIIAIKLY